MWSPAAGLAAAAALAVLPVEVITSRSDTMDGVMMVLIVLALLLIVPRDRDGSTAWLLAGAAALGLAFDVKLLESLVALPGIAVLAYLGLPGRPARRLLSSALAGLVYVVVALAWLTATLLVPASDRPYAIGSTNGSAWNAAFIFNGKDRLGGKSPEPKGTVYEPGHNYPTATQSERDHIPIIPPSATRLLSAFGPLSGQRLGMELLVALLLGLPALLWGVLRPKTSTRYSTRSVGSALAPHAGAQEPCPGSGWRRRRSVGSAAGGCGGHEGVPPASAAVAAAHAASPAAAEQRRMRSREQRRGRCRSRAGPARAGGGDGATASLRRPGGPRRTPRARCACAGRPRRHGPVDAQRASSCSATWRAFTRATSRASRRGRRDVRHRCRLGGLAGRAAGVWHSS